MEGYIYIIIRRSNKRCSSQLGRQDERNHKLMMLKKKMDRYPEDTWRDKV